MENFILRIYKRDIRDPQKIVGGVERVGGQGCRKFSSPETLWKILAARKGVFSRDGEAILHRDKTRKHLRMGEIMKIIATEDQD